MARLVVQGHVNSAVAMAERIGRKKTMQPKMCEFDAGP